MKVHILTNALDYGDAVSTHCILLARRAEEIGIEASLYAEFSDLRVERFVTPLDRFPVNAGDGDILLHQFFNHTALMPLVESFSGCRILMYHNITPPEFFPAGGPAHESCARGLDQLREIAGLYHHAAGMSEFSRRDLAAIGYESPGVFPLFLDLDRLQPDALRAGREPHGATFLFVGRVAPNKGIAGLVRFLSAYRRIGSQARLVLAGDDRQHPAYTQELHELAYGLGLTVGKDVLFTGKIPDSQLAEWYRRADAFVCLSEHEGFCAPLVESMAFDLPVFATRAGAIEDTLGGSGVLLSARDPETVAAEVHAVLGDHRRREAVLKSQRARLEAFSAEAQRAALRALADRKFPRLAVQSPRVSVVINTYNRARHLETCLATLRRQRYRNFEVVVVNGPSSDATAEVLKQFEGQIRVAETSRRVLGVSRNLGIELASGDLVAFIDDDAIADPHWLAELVKPFSDPEIGGAGGLVYRMNGQEIEFRNGIIDREGFVLWNREHPGKYWKWENGYLNTVSGNNCVFRREALEKIGGFDQAIEYYHDEADVVIRLQAAGFRTVHCPAAIVYHESAASQNRTGKYTLNWRVIAKNTLYCALKNHPDPDSRRRMAARVVRRIVQRRMGDIFHWWTSGEIGLRSFLSMEAACVKGIVRGIRNGMNPPPPAGPLSPANSKTFLPYAEEKEHAISVCLFSQWLPEQSPGGIATYTAALARGLRQSGCIVHVISRGDRWTSEIKQGIWYHTAVPLPVDRSIADPETHPTTANNLAYSRGLRAKLLDIEARWGLDVVESPNWDAEGLLASLDHRLPMVVRAHSPLFKVAETQGWEMTGDLQNCVALEGLLLRHTDVITGSTRAILELIEGYFDSAGKKALLPLGIDAAAEPVSVRRNGHVRILFVGRLERRKGIHTLLDSMMRILSERDSVEFDIVGRDEADPQKSWRKHWERQSGAWKDRVRFHGEVDPCDLARFYAECDVFVAPSIYESFGLIYLEAMACGKPVIGCRAGGIPEVVMDGTTGLLVPPGDSAALASAVTRLVDDPALAGRLGAAGLARYRESYTVDGMAARTLDLYREVAREYSTSNGVVWGGAIMDLRREPETQVLWHPENQQLCLLIPTGVPRTAVFGPYTRLKTGSYRAEFKLWAGDAVPGDCHLGTVDVFSLEAGKLGERAFRSEDFRAGAGCVLDIYFNVARSPVNDAEFRLHTSGGIPLYLRQVIVRAWPPQRLATPPAGLVEIERQRDDRR